MIIRVIAIRKNTVLVKEGQYSDKLFYIIEGAAKAYYLKDGKNVTDWFAFENEFICAINSYFLNIPSPHYIELTEPCTCICITRDAMQQLCDKHHDIERPGRLSCTKTMLQLQLIVLLC